MTPRLLASCALAALARVSGAPAVRGDDAPDSSLVANADTLVASALPDARRGSADPDAWDDASLPTHAIARPARPNALVPLVPDVAAHPYRLEGGPRPFQNRVSFSPGFGSFGDERLFTFRFAYNPNPWLGWEGTLAHNPAKSVHSVMHSLTAVLRHPFPGRLQPYGAAGYGMVMVFPGRSLNADPVTKNALAFGGGLEFYIRSDLAVRADVRRATVFGRDRDRDGVVAYDYVEQTIGLSFYRFVRP